MIPGNGYYTPKYADASCEFPNCQCEMPCNGLVPRRSPYNSSRWAIYGALAFLAVVAVVIAARTV